MTSGERQSSTEDRVNVLGVGISPINLDSARETIFAALEKGEKGYVCVTNVHAVSEAQEDPAYKAILNDSFLTTPDGMPLVWIGRWQGRGPAIDRVYGPDLMMEVFAESEKTGHTHYFYGGKEGVAPLLKSKMEERFPRARIVGTYTPPFRPLSSEEKETLLAEVERLNPDMIWVGIGAPKQEKFMAEYLPLLNTRLLFGVGAAFDFHAGLVSQAPRWIQRSGFEWLYRLCREPRRLARRYLTTNPLFVYRYFLQMTGLRRYERA